MSEPNEFSVRQRRSALEALSRERLARITSHYELDISDRRSAASHVDAIVRAKGVDFGDVLGLLGRDELKGACEALGLIPVAVRSRCSSTDNWAARTVRLLRGSDNVPLGTQ